MVVLCIPGFTGLTREARRGDADGDERSHAEARGRTRRVLVGGVTRPSRLRALRVRSRAPHVPKDSHEGREEEVLTVMNDLTLEARRTRPGTGELPREAVRGLWEYQIPWSTMSGAPRWCDRPRVQPPGGELSCEGGRCPVRAWGTLLSQYFANFRTSIFSAEPGNPHKNERFISFAGAPSCLLPKARRRPAERIAF